ncbi:hypothetical protein [Micromonospora violae]|uniref:hypothetical protein n=1 Tax=Micromonospora violae TaxID=1278207 RepID=UPI00102B74AB|nr:hypothetical protein [Micromonospora violae]
MGAVLDRLALLDVKRELLHDEHHRRIAAVEAAGLDAAWAAAGFRPPRTVPAYALLGSVHRRLWHLENATRTAERRGAFGPKFRHLFADIQRLNADRAGHRRAVDTSFGDGSETALVEVVVGLDIYADQIAIQRVRQQRLGAPTSADADMLSEIWLAYRLPDIFAGDAFRRLHLANDRLWTVKAELDAGLAGRGPSINTCRSLYLVNDARCRAKKFIALALESPVRDVKEYAPYPLPTGWDDGTLSWRPVPPI